MIRRARTADIPRVVDYVEALVRSVDGPQVPDRVTTGASVSGLMRNPDGVVFVSENGFIAGMITQTIINPARVAVELGWYATDRSGLRLLRAFEGWAQDREATLIKMSCNGGTAQELLRRLGYREAETAMVK